MKTTNPKLNDRLFRLLQELQDLEASIYSAQTSDAWWYIRTLEIQISTNPDLAPEIEKQILSQYFLTQQTFTQETILRFKPVIREYKLNLLKGA